MSKPMGPVGASTSTERVYLAETAAAAAGAYTAGAVVGCAGYRTICLYINNDCAAAAGYPVIRPRCSIKGPEPAFGDDAWFVPAVTDGVPVATLFTGAVATGVDYTGAPEWGLLTFRPMAIRTEAHDAASNEIRMIVPINLMGARWFSIEYAEVGTTGTPSALGIDYVLMS